MEAYLKKYFWVYYLSLIGLLAYSTASLANFFIENQLKKVLSVSTSPNQSSTLPTRSVVRKFQWGQTISERNLFNSTPPQEEESSSLSKDQEQSQEEAVGGFPAPYDPCEASKINAQLKVTWIAEPSSDSKAVFNVNNETRILAEGDTLEDALLVSIQWRGDGGRVVFQKDGAFSCLNLGKQKKSTPKSYSRPAYTKPKKSTSKNNIKDGIKEVSPGRYQVDRAMLDEQLSNLDKIIRQARVIPHYRGGKPAGFKVVGIRSNSIFRHLGLKSGDVLKSVGGEELSSFDKALGLFEKLKTSSNIVLDVERRGKPNTFEYDIQ